MKSTDNLPIYQNGLTLSPSEEQMLTEKAWSQSRIIAKILKNRPGQGFTFQEMRVALERLSGETVSEHSVKRGLSSMTGTKGAPDKYRDKEGRWPLLKMDEKRLNPETGIQVHLYTWNPRYKQPLTHREIVEKYKGQQQMKFFESTEHEKQHSQ